MAERRDRSRIRSSPQDARLESLDQRLDQAQAEEARKAARAQARSQRVIRSAGLRILSEPDRQCRSAAALIGWVLDRLARDRAVVHAGLMFLGFGVGVRNVLRIAKQRPAGRAGEGLKEVKWRPNQDRPDAPVPDRSADRSGSSGSGNPFVFTNSALWMLIVLALHLRVHARRDEARACPRPLADRGRGLTGFINNRCSTPISAPQGRKYVPWVFTAFMFILFANLIGMMPFGDHPGRPSVHRHQPVHRHRRDGDHQLRDRAGGRLLEARLPFLLPVRAARHAVASMIPFIFADRVAQLPGAPVQPRRCGCSWR